LANLGILLARTLYDPALVELQPLARAIYRQHVVDPNSGILPGAQNNAPVQVPVVPQVVVAP
jgi:hypothetical protein